MDIRGQHRTSIDYTNLETHTHDFANTYIEENDTVLELGARYGSISSIRINSKLQCKTNHVVVEPDERVWEALERNKKSHNCEFHIVKGFVSAKKLALTDVDSWYGGYGATYVEQDDSPIPSYTMEEINETFHLTYTVLVVDCEGFLERFLDEHPNVYDTLRLILFEAEYPEKCKYTKIRTTLKEKGFTEKLRGNQNVWIRQA